MKKILSILLSALLLFSLSLTAFAAPSVTQRGLPPVEVEEGIEVVPVFDISEDSKDPEDIEFREAYQKAQTMDVGDLVIRDVFDVRGTLKKGKNDVISFNLSSYGEVVVLYEYVDGEWQEIPEERIKWNSDGTIYVTIIDLCPLAIAVDPNFKVGNENTNDKKTGIFDNCYEKSGNDSQEREKKLNWASIGNDAMMVILGILIDRYGPSVARSCHSMIQKCAIAIKDVKEY